MVSILRSYRNGNHHEVGRYKYGKRDGEWIYYTENGKETKGIYKDGKKWSGEFWINVKWDSCLVETEDELREGPRVDRGLFMETRK